MKKCVSNGRLLLAITTTVMPYGATGCSPSNDHASESVSSSSQALAATREHHEAIDGQDGFFYTYWEQHYDAGQALMDLQPNGYTTNVDYTAVTASSPNFVVGKGKQHAWGDSISWQAGPNPTALFFGVYGWLTAPLVEYYIGRVEAGDVVGDYSTSRGRYRLRVASKIQANILNPTNDPTKPQKFLQFNCESLDGADAKVGPVDLSEHFQAWDAMMPGWWSTQTTLQSQQFNWAPMSDANYGVVVTEIYGATTGNTSVSNMAFENRVAIEPLIQSMSNSAGTLTYRVLATAPWTILPASIPAGFTVSPTAGDTGLTTITVNVTANTTGNERRANFQFNATGAPVAFGQLVQFYSGEGWIPTGAGGTSPFQISPTGNWSATSSAPSWLSVSPSQGTSGTYTLTTSATPNTSAASRSGTVTITGGGVNKTISVVQPPVSLLAEPMLATVAAGGATQTLHVYSNLGAWSASVTSGASWLSITGASSGSANGTLSFAVAANGTGHDRTGTIAITGANAPTRTVTVIENAAPWSWSSPPAGTSLIAHFCADANVCGANGVTIGSTGNVTRWADLSGNGKDVVNTFYMGGGPTYGTSDFATGKAGLTFNGGQVLWRQNWTGVPNGNNQPFTVVAVARSNENRAASVVAWWADNSYDAVRCQIIPSGTRSLLQTSRADTYGGVQNFTGSTGIGLTNHALAWEYTPEVLANFMAGGALEQSAPMSPIAPLAPNWFVIGARSTLPTELFKGVIAEVGVFAGNLSPADLGRFSDYAHTNWGTP
jgi:endo-1,4-beta-xylanase